MNSETNHETDLHRLFRSVVGPIDPPVARLVESGLAHGRKSRRRKRVLSSMVGATAAVTVISIGGFGLLREGSARSAPLGFASGGSPSPGSSPAVLHGLDARSSAAILASLLPDAGVTSGYGGQQVPQHPDVASSLSYDDGGGPVEVGVNYDHGWLPHEKNPDGWNCAGFSGLCTEEALPDGSLLLVLGPHQENGPGTVMLGVQLFRPDGTRVAIHEINQIQREGKDSPITRPDLPLTADQLAEMAKSSLWQDAVPAWIVEAGLKLQPFHLVEERI